MEPRMNIQYLSRRTAAVNLLCGFLIACFSSAHLIAVTVRRIRLKIPAWVPGEPHAMIAGVPYDFRIYSLLLFGTVILAGGLTAIRASAGIARGDSHARRRASRAMLVVLAVVIPVTPMQEAAPILIVPAAIGFATAALSPFLPFLRRAPLAALAQVRFN